MMENPDLTPLWNALLNVYDKVGDVCKKNGIRYFAAYGTVLGAVRHKGFIPWDDDFDIAMPYEDYLKFLKIAPKALPKDYALVTHDNTPGFGFNYAKVSDLRRELVDRVSRESGHPLAGGINIDIFPLAGLPRKTLLNVVTSIALRCMRNFRLGVVKRVTLASRIAYCMGAVCCLCARGFKTRDDFERYIERQERAVPFDSAKYVGLFDSHLMRFRLAVPARCFSAFVNLPFCDRCIPVPVDYDAYLKALYGDYMTPVRPKVYDFTHGRLEPQIWKYGPTNA